MAKGGKARVIEIKQEHDTDLDGPVGLAVRVMTKMKEQYKLPDTSRPHYEPPELPEDISALSSPDLGKLQGQFAAWANYIEDVSAREDLRKFVLETDEMVTLAKKRLTADGTVQERKDLAILWTEEKIFKSTEQRARARFLLVKLDQFERARAVLSREQARRDAEFARRNDEN